MYKLGSLFDGIGGWPLAATKFGINPAWSSEIEPFPQEVTKKHFPNMKHLGDITKINGEEIEPVDIITLGSPCQDLSIAGKRKGLDGERSGLFRTAINIIQDMRRASNGKYPRFVVWENVPGAFSSNKGNDFRAVLEEITETEIPIPKSGHYNKKREWCIDWATAGMVRSDKCEVAWRVLDAQYWGVPQRRKRIFLVADFATTGRSAGEILFKPESMSGDFEKSSSKGESTTGNIADSLGTAVVRIRGGCEGGGKGALVSIEKSLTLAANTNDQIVFQPIIWDMTHADEVMRPVKEGIVPTLNARMGTGGNQVPAVQEPIAYTMQRFGDYKDCGVASSLKQSATLQSKDQGGYSLNYINPVRVGYKVRRLTPTECERLQGLPEVWEVNIGEMSNDEYIAFNLSIGNISVNHNTGEVFATRGPGGIILRERRKLKGCIINGYLTYAIRNGEIKKPCRANRLVWISANGVIPKGMFVDHINNNKLDNRLENLQILSPQENSHKAKKDGLYLRGENNPATKLSENQKIKIFIEYKKGDTSYSKFANKYHISKSRIAQIIKRDGYTLIDDKKCSDSARYKALGNGMAQPCPDFVIQGIAEILRREET